MDLCLRNRLNKEHYYTNQAFWRFFAPALLSNLSLALGGIVDCLVVGSKMGASGLSAIALGIPVYLFYNIISYGFSIGGSIHYASLLADGKPEEGIKLFNNVLRGLIVIYLITVSLGIVFLPQLMAVLGADPEYPEVYALAYRYVRTQLLCVPILYCQGPFYFFVHCDNAPKRAATALAISNFVDILMNYILVICLGMGPEGSVWSTAIGAVFCLTICGTHITGKKGSLRFRWVKFCADDLIKSIRTGISSSVQYLFQFVVVIFANKLLMISMGMDGVAVFDVVYNLSLFTASLADSASMAIQPMVSSFRSERDFESSKETLRLSLKYGSLLCTVLIAILVIWSKGLCRFFGLDGTALIIGIPALRIYALSILPAFWNQCCVYYDQADEREAFAFVTDMLRVIALWLPSAFILYYLLPEAFWWVYPLSEAGTLVYVLLVSHPLRRKNTLAEGESLYTSSVSINSNLGMEVENFQNVCETWDCSPKESYYGSLVLEELCAAILEDSKHNSMQDVNIKFTVLKSPEGFTIFLRDSNVVFNPFEMKRTDSEEVNTLGMDIVKKRAKEFFYRRFLGFNMLVVRL